MNIDGNTQILGVLGNPISHTLSPVIHNFIIDKYKLNTIYLPFEVEKNDFDRFICGISGLKNMKGFNITVPYKVMIQKYCDTVSKEAKIIGAVNTVHIKNKKIHGYNTDSFGFLESLNLNFPGFKLSGKSILLLGAGGAAKASAYALLKNRIKRLIILNRTYENGVKLRKYLLKHFPKADISVVPLKYNYLQTIDFPIHLIINSSSYGLKEGKPVINLEHFKEKDCVVYDLIYNPVCTSLLKSAQKYKLSTLNGLDMLILQALYSFSIWTGVKRNELYKNVKILRKRLSCFF